MSMGILLLAITEDGIDPLWRSDRPRIDQLAVDRQPSSRHRRLDGAAWARGGRCQDFAAPSASAFDVCSSLGGDWCITTTVQWAWVTQCSLTEPSNMPGNSP